MATIADRVFDNGLTVLDTEANKITVTSQESTTFASANATQTHNAPNNNANEVGKHDTLEPAIDK